MRDVYDFGERLLIVATDRISAFDWILPNGIPDKGRVLTQLSRMWFERLATPHHLLSYDPATVSLPPGTNRDELAGRFAWKVGVEGAADNPSHGIPRKKGLFHRVRYRL